jgi:hypothetical protein
MIWQNNEFSLDFGVKQIYIDMHNSPNFILYNYSIKNIYEIKKKNSSVCWSFVGHYYPISKINSKFKFI